MPIYIHIGGGGVGNWVIFYVAHIEDALRVHLSHFAPSRDVWFGQNKYFT